MYIIHKWTIIVKTKIVERKNSDLLYKVILDAPSR